MGTNNSNYQSGGRMYDSPNKQIATGVQRELIADIGDVSKIKSMELAEVLDVLLRNLEKFTESAQLLPDELDQAKQRITQAVNNSDNSSQAMKMGANQMSKFLSSRVTTMQSFAKVRGTDAGKGNLGQILKSPFLQSVHIQQEILNRLNEMNGNLGVVMKEQKQGNDEEEGLFDALRQTIVHSIFNSPTASKLGSLGASLISAGLFKVASNEKMPSVVRQAAMGAVYFEIPQTMMNIVGAVLQTTVSMWLSNSASKLLGNALGGIVKQAGSSMGGFLGNAGSLITKALPVAIPIILAAGGIIALIKGIADHRKSMKAKDAEIANNPNLTQSQKDWKRVGEHSKSGAKVGAVSGALIGAAIGTFIAPGIGTAIGGAIGGAVTGGALGAAIGSIKPLGNIFKKGLHSLGDKITNGARWAIEHRSKIMAKLSPVFDVIKFVLETASPVFMLLKMFVNKFMGSDFFKRIFGDKSPNDNDTSGGAVGTPISLDKTKGGRPQDQNLVDLRDVNSKYGVQLKGSIQNAGKVWGNSKPWTRKENLATFAYLDNTLNTLGINAVYSSNMGGSHKKGAKSHGNGDKVDVVGESWTPAQYKYMFDKGFFGKGTGALGYEYKIGQTEVTTPEEYARLFKERNGNMMGGNNHYDLTNKDSLITVSSDDEFYNQYQDIKRKVKAEKDILETKAKDNSMETIINPTSAYLPTTPNFSGGTGGDITGMNDYRNLTNSTRTLVNQG